MARPRKPTNVLEMNGAFKHDPQRRAARANEPRPQGKLGKAPSTFTKEEKKVWNYLAKSFPWLTECDRIIVTQVCKLTAKLDNGTIKPQENSSLLSALSRIGGSPADRSKINAPTTKEEEKDGWDEF